MPEEDFEIVRDEYIGNDKKFVKDMMFSGVDPRIFHAEMYGSWVQKEDEPDWRCQTASSKRIPVCADSFREKRAIIERLLVSWCHRPELSLGKLMSMPFLRLQSLADSGDYDIIQAIEASQSADYSPCNNQKDLRILQALKRAISGLEAATDSFERLVSLFEEGE